jgi:hypothetical protein
VSNARLESSYGFGTRRNDRRFSELRGETNDSENLLHTWSLSVRSRAKGTHPPSPLKSGKMIHPIDRTSSGLPAAQFRTSGYQSAALM